MTTESSENGYLTDDSLDFDAKMLLTFSKTRHDVYAAMSDLHNGIMRMLEARAQVGSGLMTIDETYVKLDFVRTMLMHIVEDCDYYEDAISKRMEGSE